MPLSYTELRDEVEQRLQDTGNAVYSTTEIDQSIKNQLKRMSNVSPYVRRESFNFEARYGSASATTADHLIDTTLDQFLATDVGKVIYNRKDRTWALVTAYTSATDLTLSKDIMVSGEGYDMYNQRCTDHKELYIGDIDEYLDILFCEYYINRDPIQKRNFVLRGEDKKILLPRIDFAPKDTYECYVYFVYKHHISQLTDHAAAVNNVAGYSAGDTSMAMDALQAAGTIEKGQEFTIANVRGLYRVVADATIAANAATVSFFPALESDVANNAVVTFKATTLKPELEDILVDLVAGDCAMSKAISFINEINKGGSDVWRKTYEWGKLLHNEARRELQKYVLRRVNERYSRV